MASVSSLLKIIIDGVDPSRGQTILFAKIDCSASGVNIIVAANPSGKIKVLSYFMVADSAVSAKWQSASTDLSGAMSFSANGGIASPVGTPAGGWILETQSNQALNLFLSGSVGVRGHISYFVEA